MATQAFLEVSFPLMYNEGTPLSNNLCQNKSRGLPGKFMLLYVEVMKTSSSLLLSVGYGFVKTKHILFLECKQAREDVDILRQSLKKQLDVEGKKRNLCFQIVLTMFFQIRAIVVVADLRSP